MSLTSSSRTSDLVEALRALQDVELRVMCNSEFDLYLRQLELAQKVIGGAMRKAYASLISRAPYLVDE